MTRPEILAAMTEAMEEIWNDDLSFEGQAAAQAQADAAHWANTAMADLIK